MYVCIARACSFTLLSVQGVFMLLAFQGSPRARKISEFHLARWASNSQVLLVRGSSPLAQVFELINNS